LLEPERMWSYQASIEFQPSAGFAASLTGYYADLDNIIVVTGRYPNLALSNGGRALNRGLSTNARWRLNRRLALRGGYAYLRSTNLAPYVPSHKATYQVELNLDKAFVYIGGVTLGSRWANSAKTAEMHGYTLPTLKLMIPVGRDWTLFATVDNLFDEDYQVVAGYPMPGINATGGFTYRF
jgi:vitamin B12 transporter